MRRHPRLSTSPSPFRPKHRASLTRSPIYCSVQTARTTSIPRHNYSFAGGAPPNGALRPAALRCASCCWTAGLGPFLLALSAISHHPPDEVNRIGGCTHIIVLDTILTTIINAQLGTNPMPKSAYPIALFTPSFANCPSNGSNQPSYRIPSSYFFPLCSATMSPAVECVTLK